MFNLYRIKNNDFLFKSKNHLNNNLLFTKTNYLPKNVEYNLINNNFSLVKKESSFAKIESLFAKREKPDLITIFYMILGITFGSFIYYIKL